MKPGLPRAARELARGSLLLSALVSACSDRPSAAAQTAAAAEPAIAVAAGLGTPVAGVASDYDPLLAAVGDARFVLLGESTHGTSEFYRERARITERLVRERGFKAVAIEAGWPEVDRLNRYVRGLNADRTAAEAMADFKRFPRWMWRNAEFVAFADALRAYNMTQPVEQRVGLYGMDVQNLYDGMDDVAAWLALTDRPAAARARSQYRCFARFGTSHAKYGEATQRGRTCEREAAAVLAEVQRRPRSADPAAAEARFSAIRSAAAVAGAEQYFRASYAGAYSWNVRDRLMATNVAEIAAHAESLSGEPGRVAIWAHNTHSGDARSTAMADRGELNIGQLLRVQDGERAFLVGFMTYGGTVRAAPEWDAPDRLYTLRPAIRESYAGFFHTQELRNRLLVFRGQPTLSQALAGPRLERAVGVIYLPDQERAAHYSNARLSAQFDALVYLDRTQAVTSLR